jgi:hypothetical protein
MWRTNNFSGNDQDEPRSNLCISTNIFREFAQSFQENVKSTYTCLFNVAVGISQHWRKRGLQVDIWSRNLPNTKQLC